MDKIAIEICLKTRKFTRNVLHLNNGKDPGFVKIIFENSSDCAEVKEYIKDKMEHLELFLSSSIKPNELYYENVMFHRLGMEEEFEFPHTYKSNPVDTFKIVDSFLNAQN
jgi:hypothetical protein